MIGVTNSISLSNFSYQRKKNQYRIVLSLNKESIPEELIQWDALKDSLEGKEFEFQEVSNKKDVIEIYYNGNPFEISLANEYRGKDLSMFKKVIIYKVDSLNKSLSYSLVL